MQRPDTDRVRRHYAELAPRYNAGANAACNRRYLELLGPLVAGAKRVLEVGAGAHSVLPHAAAGFKTACDLSLPMLRHTPASLPRVCCDAQSPPFAEGAFDVIVSVNVLEHVPDPERLLQACAKLLRPGGTLGLITPNGDVAGLLELLEVLRLKLPEGPHCFVKSRDLRHMAEAAEFKVRELRPVLALPAGPPAFVRGVDAVCARARFGLFLYGVFTRS